MSAAERFKNANTNFGADRVKPLPPIYREEKDDKGVTKLVFERAAHYRVQVEKCVWIDPRKGPDLYISEFRILKSNNDKAQVGSRHSYKQNTELDAANTRMVEFMFAASGVDRREAEGLAIIKQAEAENLIPQMLAETLDDPTDPSCKNSLKGAIIDVEVEERISKDGFPYKHYSFFPVKQEQPAATTEAKK